MSQFCVGIHNNTQANLNMVNTTVVSETVNAKALSLWNLGQAEVTACSLSATSSNGVADVVWNQISANVVWKKAGASVRLSGSTLSATSGNGDTKVVWNQAGADVRISGSTLTAESDQGIARGVLTSHDSNTDVRNCKISANTNGESSKGVHNSGILTVTGSVITADAPNEDAVGVDNADRCILIDTNVEGIHSGCQNTAHLYVRGGTFTGWTHGGLYMCSGDRPAVENGETGEGYLNYINDAVLRCGYFGRHVEEIKATWQPFGSCGYIGSGKNITGYLDGCTIGGPVLVDFDPEEYSQAHKEAYPDREKFVVVPYGITFRSNLGERDNVVYISNSRIYNCIFRIDRGEEHDDLGHRLYVGGGTNITQDSVNNVYDTIFTGTESYRQSEAWFRAQVM